MLAVGVYLREGLLTICSSRMGTNSGGGTSLGFTVPPAFSEGTLPMLSELE